MLDTAGGSDIIPEIVLTPLGLIWYNFPWDSGSSEKETGSSSSDKETFDYCGKKVKVNLKTKIK